MNHPLSPSTADTRLLARMRLHVPRVSSYVRITEKYAAGFDADNRSAALFYEHAGDLHWFHNGFIELLQAELRLPGELPTLAPPTLSPGQIYVGLLSRFGNPYVTGPDGDRALVRHRYRAWLWRHLQAGVFTRDHLLALDGFELVSDWHADTAHHDVLRAAVQWARSDQGEEKTHARAIATEHTP